MIFSFKPQLSIITEIGHVNLSNAFNVVNVVEMGGVKCDRCSMTTKGYFTPQMKTTDREA